MRKEILPLVIAFLLISVANAAQLNATLKVVPEIKTKLILEYPTSVKANQDVAIKIRYLDENNTDIKDANVVISINGEKHSLSYSNDYYIYEFKEKNIGVVVFSVNATKQGYETQIKQGSISIKSKYKPSSSLPNIRTIVCNETNEIPPVRKDEVITISIDNEDIPIKNISLHASKTIAGGQIIIKKQDCKEFNISGIPYKCFMIDLKGISSEQIKNANMIFDIYRVWINKNDVNKSSISVLKIEGNSTSIISINKVSETSEKLSFSFSTDSFSYFVIYGQKNKEVILAKPSIIKEIKDENLETVGIIIIAFLVALIFKLRAP